MHSYPKNVLQLLKLTLRDYGLDHQDLSLLREMIFNVAEQNQVQIPQEIQEIIAQETTPDILLFIYYLLLNSDTRLDEQQTLEAFIQDLPKIRKIWTDKPKS